MSSSNRSISQRTVHVPPQQYECSQCGKNTDLRLCVCREELYCSVKCQKIHWKSTHKIVCAGEPDLIDIMSLHPLLAMLVESCHVDGRKPIHPALSHTITRSPAITALPDGANLARVITLGDPLPTIEIGRRLEAWWPTSASPASRTKLLLRILREGYLVPILTALCLGLVGEIYTTTDDPAASRHGDSLNSNAIRRLRLKYRSSPISDFGIVKGSVRSVCQLKLAYHLPAECKTFPGQDPEDHYWLYFTTLKGEEIFLDYGLYSFDFGLLVETTPYRQPFLPAVDKAPGYMCGDRHDTTRDSFTTHTPKQYFSFLRDKRMHHMHAQGLDSLSESHNVRAIWAFMDRVAARECTPAEKVLAVKWAEYNCGALSAIVKDPGKCWKQWPQEPGLGIHPIDEAIEKELGYTFPAHGDHAQWRPLLKLTETYAQGKISATDCTEGYMKWKSSHSPSNTAS